MLRVGIIGFGGMGHYHGRVYGRRKDTELVAVADIDPKQLEGRAMEINIGAAEALNLSGAATYRSARRMLEREELDLVSICLPTDLHARYAILALRRGVHVLCEKPMSRTLRQADELVAAQRASGRLLMVAQCLRFWPAYERVVEAYHSGEFGRLLMLSMRRVSGMPGWSKGHSWFMEGRRSGGCLLDMHIHDTDFTQHLLGVPEAVVTTGRTAGSGAIDHSFTQYLYPDGPIAMAEASWSYSGGFVMSFCAMFEQATLEMGYQDGTLRLLRPGQAPDTVALPAGDGYEREIDYFIGCIAGGTAPARCTPESTAETLRIALAEERSAQRGGARVRL